MNPEMKSFLKTVSLVLTGVTILAVGAGWLNNLYLERNARRQQAEKVRYEPIRPKIAADLYNDPELEHTPCLNLILPHLDSDPRHPNWADLLTEDLRRIDKAECRNGNATAAGGVANTGNGNSIVIDGKDTQ